MLVFRAASTISAVSSITIVALPAPTPYAGFPELYAAFTIAGPPVAIVRSQMLISSFASGMLGGSELTQRSAHHANGFVRRLLTRRMRREDHRVAALDRVDRDADRRHVR